MSGDKTTLGGIEDRKTKTRTRISVRGGPWHTVRPAHVAGAAEAASRMVAVTAQVDDARRALLRPGAAFDEHL